MGFADLLVVGLYFAAIVAVGFWAGRGQRGMDHYFLGGRRQPWVVVGLSLLATELSALTFVSVPGRAYQTDCHYLQYYFGSFIGRLLIVWLLLPAFYGSHARAGRVTTAYEYLGRRFGPWTRTTTSLFFFASRVMGSGLRLLVAAIAISVIFDWSLPWVVAGTVVVAVGYTTFGGIKAIIWTDALQAFVFLGGAVVVLVYLFATTPGTVADNLATATSAGKLDVFTWDVDPNNDRSFWVLLIYNIFLTAAVFGTDQDFTQRMLTCSNLKGGQRSLVMSAIVGFPVVVLFLMVGVMMHLFDQAHAEFSPLTEMAQDRVFPFFIANALPTGWGIKGLLLAGVFAAAMSSLDSALGALSSSAVVDLYRPYVAPERSDAHYVAAGRVFVVMFGLSLGAIALAFAHKKDLLLEAFAWASLIFGPMLGVFLLGVLTNSRGNDRINPLVMLSAVGSLAVLKYTQDVNDPYIAWPWWVVVGTVWTFAMGALFRRSNHVGDPPAL